MDKLFFKKILHAILIVGMVIYVIFLFVDSTKIENIETETVKNYTVTDIVSTKCFVVRDELLVKNSNEGIVSYRIKDGANVSVGQDIADVYNNEKNAVTRQQIEKLDKQIHSLEELSNAYYTESVGIDTVNTQIENNIFSILSSINDGDYLSADNYRDNLLYSINERQIITGQEKNFNKKIQRLKAERKALDENTSDKVGTIKSSAAGYFISQIDGYERNFKYGDVAKITLKDYEGISHAEYTTNYVGKIITDPEWYLVCKINKSNALTLTNLYGKGVSLKLKIPFISSQTIPAEIIAVNYNRDDSEGVLVLSCDYMNEEISKARIEDVKIEIASYSGLKISKRAITDGYVTKYVNQNGKNVKKTKKVQGVYVLRGSEIVFKEIVIKHSTKDYVICDPNPNEKLLFNGKTVTLYDRVIIEGNGLYDGKIVK